MSDILHGPIGAKKRPSSISYYAHAHRERNKGLQNNHANCRGVKEATTSLDEVGKWATLGSRRVPRVVELVIPTAMDAERSLRPKHKQHPQNHTEEVTHVILLLGDIVICDAETISDLGAVWTASDAKADGRKGTGLIKEQVA